MLYEFKFLQINSILLKQTADYAQLWSAKINFQIENSKLGVKAHLPSDHVSEVFQSWRIYHKLVITGGGGAAGEAARGERTSSRPAESYPTANVSA